MKSIINLCVVTGLLVLSACAGGSSSSKNILPAQPIPQPVQAQTNPFDIKNPVVSEAGLWRDLSAVNLFQDMRAHRVGDLVTVNIVETSKASKKAGTQTGRDSSIDAGINNLLGWEDKIKYLTSFGNDDVMNDFDNTAMFNASMSNSYTGSGSTSRDESMTASITAKVVDVMPNGNLAIQGSREVKVNKETQYIILSGTIRPVDISPNNTVLSSYIGDARIEYIGKGPISDKQSQGWLTRAVDFVWPF